MDSSDVQSLFCQQRNDNRHLRLRFDQRLESLFRHQLLQMALRLRLFFGLFLLFLYLITPLLDHWLLHPPSEFVAQVRPIQFGTAVPLILATVLASVVPRLTRASNALIALALMAVALGAMYQRLLGHELDYVAASSWASITIMGGFFFSGLRFFYFLPIALLLFGLNVWTEATIGLATDTALGALNTAYEIQVMSLMFILGAAGSYLLETNARLNWLEANNLEQLTLYDDLTRVWTRGSFNIAYRRLFDLARREQRPLAVAMVDIDHFKAFNDCYGHAAGDHCLATIARQLNRICEQESGYCARLGGEEFAVLFYGREPSKARLLLQDICDAVRTLSINHEASPEPSRVVTVSIGGYCLYPGRHNNRFSALREADDCLYRAKAEGRDRLVMSMTPEGHHG